MPPKRPPRLAILGSRGIPARYGGFETFVEELSTRLVERGVDVTVYCESEPGPRPTEYRGVRLEHVGAWAPGPARTIQFDVSCLRRAAREHDVVYLLGYGAAFAAFLPRLGGARVWINPDGLEWQRAKWGWPARAWLRAMESVACRLADRIVFDNGALAEHVLGRHAVRDSSVLAYGAPVLERRLDPGPLADFGLESDGYHLLVCRFEPENQVQEIVRAHELLDDARPLIVVANKELDSTYARKALSRASDRVRFVGTIYDQDVLLPVRQHACTYVHGHSVGGTNPSLLEAMGCGNLVLAHDNPFNREVLGESDVYWRTPVELAERMTHWESRTPGERAATGRANQKRVRARYSWETLADDYSRLVEIDSGLTVSGAAPRRPRRAA